MAGIQHGAIIAVQGAPYISLEFSALAPPAAYLVYLVVHFRFLPFPPLIALER